MEPIIFHIDVNSAFLSWTALSLLEQGETTDLREIPSIIGGDIQKRHGVVLAKSTSAKKYGIQNTCACESLRVLLYIHMYPQASCGSVWYSCCTYTCIHKPRVAVRYVFQVYTDGCILDVFFYILLFTLKICLG